MADVGGASAVSLQVYRGWGGGGGVRGDFRETISPFNLVTRLSPQQLLRSLGPFLLRVYRVYPPRALLLLGLC